MTRRSSAPWRMRSGMGENASLGRLDASQRWGATFDGQGRPCGALGHIALAGPELQQEAKVQSTISA